MLPKRVMRRSELAQALRSKPRVFCAKAFPNEGLPAMVSFKTCGDTAMIEKGAVRFLLRVTNPHDDKAAK